ncbi:hypothetical protein [Hymenobacter weizhouensis]|uniref:hypothetical protein n=1 Tax=Hymenobacter sp. YIM 151500-1 TaxID=2987689 RepID=UPI002226F991|nr:hypothetical protein [Hymenobacter sp. YIM 151500-1]UYZ62566.1 hypothetical protein OIS53_16390 [Hymenobacter sp. YIM 151500-1]
MNSADVTGWAVKLLVFGLQAALLYAGVRLYKLSGGFVLNPFQPGWSKLEQTYASTTPMTGMDAGSARIGLTSYSGTLYLGFDAQELVMQKMFFGKTLLRIPYARISCTTPPRRETVLGISIQLDGVFVVDGVEIGLKADTARELLARLPTQPGAPPQPELAPL